MNEKIRELSEQVGITEANLSDGNMSYNELEKFAELIIKECAKLALTFNYNLQSLNDKEIRSHANRVSDYVKDHMGCNNEQSV